MSVTSINNSDVFGLPSYDQAAEQAVLGSLLLSSEAIHEVVDILTAQDFYVPRHQAIYQAIVDMYAHGRPIDSLMVLAEIQHRGELERIGGGVYLSELINSTPTAANVSFYAESVREQALRRTIHTAGQQIIGISGRPGSSEIIRDQAEKVLFEALAARDRSSSLAAFGDLLGPLMDSISTKKSGDLTGLPTGFKDLDRLTHGLHPGQLVIVAGRPGIGKSVLGADLVRQVAIRQRQHALVFSLEMSHEEIMQRLLAAESSVPLSKIRSGNLTDDDLMRLARCAGDLSGVPIMIDESATITMTDIRSRARRYAAQHPLGLIVVDYLQLMTGTTAPGRRAENRQQEVADFSRALKLLAKELDVPVVAMSQLNRGPEQRTDKRPQLSDLRESGSIEQDADVVILIHRPDIQGGANPPRPGEADFIVAKNRSGPTGDVTVAHQLHYSRFIDMGSANHTKPTLDHAFNSPYVNPHHTPLTVGGIVKCEGCGVSIDDDEDTIGNRHKGC